jgi:hypothetical protein
MLPVAVFLCIHPSGSVHLHHLGELIKTLKVRSENPPMLMDSFKKSSSVRWNGQELMNNYQVNQYRKFDAIKKTCGSYDPQVFFSISNSLTVKKFFPQGRIFHQLNYFFTVKSNGSFRSACFKRRTWVRSLLESRFVIRFPFFSVISFNPFLTDNQN